MKKLGIEFKWAVRFIFIYLAWAMGEKLLGLYDGNTAYFALSSVLFYLFAIVIFIAAMREKKRKIFHDRIHFRQAAVSGIYMAAFIALLVPFAQIIIYKAIAPHFLDSQIAKATAAGNTHAAEMLSLQSIIVQTVFFMLSIGVVYAAIVAYFLQAKDKTTTL
jgi:hypothetical protein